MLVLTDSACNAVQALTAQAPADAGLRISTAPSTHNNATAVFALAVTDGPQPNDEVLNQEGARVFLEHDASMMLDKQTLDAEMDNEKQVSFFVR
jgi:Fe-S cluster assembly iron-binding protein IscA